MKRMLIVSLVVPNAARRAAGKAQIENYLSGLPDRWAQNAEPDVSDLVGNPPAFDVIGIRVNVRVTSAASAEQIEATLRNFITTNSQYIATGSSIRFHLCSHDENPPVPCSESVLWEK